jgi:hypothetical protein
MVLIIVAILLIVLGAIAKSIMDIIAHKFRMSIFNDKSRFKENFWNPKHSWKNKWTYNHKEKTLRERFPLSSTVLVFTTDAWHFFQALSYNPLAIALYLLGILVGMCNPSLTIYVVVPVIALGLFKVIFQLFYSKVVIKKK